MMVDDDPIMMELVQAFLEEEGYKHFITIEDSTQAMSAIQTQQPDILLLDLNMPQVNGFEILQEVRQTEGTTHLPVIVLTSSSDAESKLRALELGATDFLAKPVDPSELALRLRNTLNAKAYLDKLENYDSLTGLPNRKLFLDRLSWALTCCKRQNQSLGILNISLERFKQINETLGPKAGDLLLQEVSQRLIETVRKSDVVTRTGSQNLWRQVSRLGGDEFCILLPALKHAENAAFVARRIITVFEKAFIVDGHEIFLNASIGIVTAPDDGMDSDILLKHVNAAAEFARHQGKNSYLFYSKEINQQAAEKLGLETDLRKALEKNELELYYQPKISMQGDVIMGMEALLRWNHPHLGMVSPAKFIPLAEELELIVPIGEWVLAEACRQYREWEQRGLGSLKLSVNVSPIQFKRQDFCELIKKTLADTGMSPEHLVLEITESMVQDSSDRGIDALKAIKEIGPSFSIDDFGTGYSSLSSLKRMPISELKIDRSFIIDVTESDDGAAIVKAIVAMARSLDLNVVAEGVETEQQLEYLRTLDCEVIQGFYFSKPLNSEAFFEFASQSKADYQKLLA